MMDYIYSLGFVKPPLQNNASNVEEIGRNISSNNNFKEIV